jgi:hypothetical protein
MVVFPAHAFPLLPIGGVLTVSAAAGSTGAVLLRVAGVVLMALQDGLLCWPLRRIWPRVRLVRVRS